MVMRRTPVIPTPPLDILVEPVPNTYVVDSMMVVLTKRWTYKKPSTQIQGTMVTPGWKGCFITTGGEGGRVPSGVEVSVSVGTPVCLRGWGKA